ncbi:MAG: nucleotidyltransferase family protein [Scytolyngbya sp. HA4215-MV1]|nr:nucleotidyltransferase family protein [Scytolyngbya sp. HA4215-MV1]
MTDALSISVSPTLEEILQRLRQVLPQLRSEYGVTSLGVFGSYVRGEQTETSDIDVLVEFEPDRRFGLFQFCHLENELSDLLGRKVDLVMKDGLKPRIGERILQEVMYL